MIKLKKIRFKLIDNSLPAHIMQIYQRRETIISEDLIRTYLRKHIQTLSTANGKDDAKRQSIRKKVTKN